MAEAFVKLFKRYYARVSDLRSAEQMIEWLEDCFEDYNKNHPHKGLKILLPRKHQMKQPEIV